MHRRSEGPLHAIMMLMHAERTSRRHFFTLRCCLPVIVASLIATACGAAEPGYSALVRRVAPSVVTVLVAEEGAGAGERAARRSQATDTDAVGAIIRRLLTGASGEAGPAESTSALGSGFVIREDGLIVTNRHVIAGAREVRVRLPDGREMLARVVGADATSDIALLKIDAGHLPALHLGSSEAVSVGDAVIAIGNPYGLGQSVSAGIVSARARTLEDDPYIDFLQTDAAINRGNSGGPLLAADGTVVGVTSAIFSPSGGSVGLGFAIPAETVDAVARELEAHGHVERGYIGISAQALTPLLARTLGLKSTDGAVITAVDGEGPAADALSIGDVMVSIGPAPVVFGKLSKITARLVPGTLVPIKLVRAGSAQTVAVKIGRQPEPTSDPLAGSQDTWIASLGLGVAETTDDIRRTIKATNEPSGVIVTQLRHSGPGALAGLKVGDLITHLGGHQLTSVGDIVDVDQPSADSPVLLRVVRDGAASFVPVTGQVEP
jgi:serine protease Do